MRKFSCVLFSTTLLLVTGLLYTGCTNDVGPGPIPGPSICIDTLLVPLTTEGPTGRVKKVPYVCDEIILDPANKKIDGWRKFLLEHGFVKKETCACGNKLELWQHLPDSTFNVIGVVEDPPPEVDAITGEDPTGASLNFILAFDPPGLDTIVDPVQPVQITNPCPGEAVKVAVVDTGVDTEGSPPGTIMAAFGWDKAIAGERCPNPQDLGFNIPKPAEDPEDIHGHGTSVNGVVTGIPYYNDIMLNLPLKFLNIKVTDNASGSGTLFRGLCGIYHAIGEGARVINISWGYMGNSNNREIPMIARCLDAARADSIIVVAGMGNAHEQLNGFSKFLPASLAEFHTNVISVGAQREYGFGRASFSNWSTNPNEMTLLAPGVNIVTAYPKKLQSSPTGLARQSGTSMAAPFVTRTVAAIWSQDPDMPFDQVITAIKNTGYNAGGFLFLNHQAAVHQVCPGFP